jgi:Domain of unknown function (DUF4304)
VILERLNPHVTAVLRRHGFGKFGKRNPTYHRTRDERIEMVNIQGDTYNRKTEGSFTANVAMFFPTLDRFVSEYPVRDRAEEYQCPIRFQIGWIATDGPPATEDLLAHWWEFGPGIDPAAVGTLAARARSRRGRSRSSSG